MRYGRLDRRVTFQRRTSALSASGQPVESWSDLATRYASVAPLRGSEQYGTPQLVALQQVQIEIRYSAATASLRPTDRIVFPAGSHPDAEPITVYDIIAVHEIGRREGQRIIAERRPDIIAPFSLLSLSPHIWLDASDLSTLFQERTGAGATTPAEIDGPVGTWLDKSGHGHHATASSDASRPTLRSGGGLRWLECADGTGLSVSYPSIGAQFSRLSAVRMLGTSGNIFIGASGSGLLANSTDGFIVWHSTGFNALGTLPGLNVDIVVSERWGGALEVGVDADEFSGAFVADGNSTLGIGLVESRVYELMQFARLITDTELGSLRSYLAGEEGRPL